MKENCAWCGEYKEVYGWKESVDVNEKGNEVHAPICKECYDSINGEEITQVNQGKRS